MAATSRPSLVAPRSAPTLDASRGPSGTFDVDAFHVMDQRDNALIADELLSGAQSSKFVYDFEIAGSRVSGVSVVGARHLASHYGGLQHRLVASTQKVGSLFIFTSYPAADAPMAVHAAVIHELAEEDDFFGTVVEVKDIKTGNSIQVEARETRYERKRNGQTFERPHYSKIAQSKAYRNAILDLIPQDVVLRWKDLMLRASKSETVTESVIEEKRAGVLRYAAAKGIGIDRRAVEKLMMDQIAGLSDAAREGNAAAFTNSAKALGLLGDGVVEDDDGAGQGEAPAAKEAAAKTATATKSGKAAAAGGTAQIEHKPEPDVNLSGKLKGSPAEPEPATATQQVQQQDPPAQTRRSQTAGLDL